MALTGGGNHMSFGVPASKEKEKEKEGDKKSTMTIEQLDWHAIERWEVGVSHSVTSFELTFLLDYLTLYGIIRKWYNVTETVFRRSSPPSA